MNNTFDMLIPNIKDLIRLPFQPEVFLCGKTHTRWIYDGKELFRDFEGEVEWEKMGTHVGKTYKEVFSDSFKYASNV